MRSEALKTIMKWNSMNRLLPHPPITRGTMNTSVNERVNRPSVTFDGIYIFSMTGEPVRRSMKRNAINQHALPLL